MMTTHILRDQRKGIGIFLSELRDSQIQKDPIRFRMNLERLGFLMAYEIAQVLPSKSIACATPLGIAQEWVPEQLPVIATVLRAGLPFHQGLLQFFDRAESAFVAAYRDHHAPGEPIKVHLNYLAAPNLNNKILIIADPMLATGQSMVQTYEALLRNGTPQQIHLVSVLAAPEGVAYLQNQISTPVHFWTAALDERLNENAYIVPSLGDAGDLSYGEKL
jgi:uracil phosphoribosyltransferase